MKTLRLTVILAFLAVSFLVQNLAAMVEESSSKTQFGYPALSREDFNSLAIEENIPLYWYEDEKNSGMIDPAEVITLGTQSEMEKYVKDGRFTDKFKQAYEKLVQAKRKDLLRRELRQGRPAVIYTDLSGYPEGDKEFANHIIKAADIIEQLYQIQKGSYEYKKDLKKLPNLDKALYQRNQGVWCEAIETQGSPFCIGYSDFVTRKSDAYPQDIEQDEKMCEMLKNQPNGKELLSPFTVVRRDGDKFKALPYNDPTVYGPLMKKVANELKKAARSLSPNEETALKKYLLAAAEGFETNNWEAADEAWAAMSPDNSKWYLRIAPDEVYYDPCQQKAGFEVSFALISKGSKVWKDKLNPLREDMEERIAKLAGPAYSAREVSFQMPEFIDIVLNAGDARKSLLATVGQSLPNWGPVAEEGRGRTVSMTNFYADPEALAYKTKKAELLFDPKTMKYYDPSSEVSLLNTILHEATHNLGPHSDYKVKGKVPKELFGGRLASIMEELKADTGGAWFLDYIYKKGLIDKNRLYNQYAAFVYDCFNHLAQGLFTASGNPRVYSQISAIELGTFLEDGAVKKVTYKDPSTGKSDWRFSIDFPKMHKSIEGIIQKTLQIKALGNERSAKMLVDYFVTGKGFKRMPVAEIGVRYRSYPKENYYYSIKLN